MNYEELYTLAERVEERLQPVFRGFERTAEKNTKKAKILLLFSKT